MTVLTELRHTCFACPSQWEGRDTEDRPVYIRYRHGRLTVSIGPPGGSISDAIESGVDWDDYVGSDLDGCMGTGDMLKRTGIILLEKGRE